MADALNDPLLAAVVGKLPMPGSPYPLAQRINWLRMAVIAMNEAYGVADPITVAGVEPPRSTGPLKLLSLEQTDVVPSAAEPNRAPSYRVDAQGFALRGEEPIDPQDVPSGVALADERGALEQGDVATILWKSAGAIAAEKLPHIKLRAA